MSQENEDGVFTHYDNVRLTCPFEDSQWKSVGRDVTYFWRIPMKAHCPLYQVQNFKEQRVKYDDEDPQSGNVE